MRRYDDPVEVRKGETEGPDQFLWRGRLWLVREVVAHWVETGSWWVRQLDPAGPTVGRAGDLLHEQEVWRVTAARGREAARLATDPGYGVFDLTFDWSGGQWRLARVAD